MTPSQTKPRTIETPIFLFGDATGPRFDVVVKLIA